MASASQSDSEDISANESDVTESDSDQLSDLEADHQVYGNGPCKYYNRGGCKNGGRCTYLHICKYFLKGSCRYGSTCKLNHSLGTGPSSRMGSWNLDQSSNPTLTDGRCYQWQLNDKKGWKDIENDYILEAQYSLPHVKSIKIYNTAYGAVSIDFTRMREYGKNLEVRRLDDGQTEWVWYCTLKRKWIKYGDKDSKGNPSPTTSSDIEKEFQSDPKSSFTFSIGGETFEIKFKEMKQVGTKKRRKVTRRPVFRPPAGLGVVQAASALQRVSLGSKPQWEFEGDRGKWHKFKSRDGTSTECSVTSDDIERKYQLNNRDIMTFKVNRDSYKLDFGAMIQTNLQTKHTRRIRRVLV
ncbi:protein mono-ADP-ribosyltransferase PARP12 [Melanotaenia boesemani]|uniref:protein mono-ADP-ribosyltransferase PARP12 n=1 Tax=Melanotaenia boesemani TaxID=1250792 RepID=UPI001C05480F|nr:protein mono-ADP-ribosyltransferase PARP12 [Melanotaenia boesemani]